MRCFGRWELKQRKYIMDSCKYKTVEILFFGAGKKGKYWLDYCKDYGIVPKGMIDNNPKLGNGMFEDVRVYSPDILKTLSYMHIFITCNCEEEIYQQLIGLGVEADKIVRGGHNFINHFLYYAVSEIYPLHNITEAANSSDKRKIVFDLQNGMVLGGVEAWTYSLAKMLKNRGYSGLYLVTDAPGPSVTDKTYPAQLLTYEGLAGENKKIELCIKKIIENLPCTVICNFPQNIFWSACIVKRLYPDSIRIIAVQHSDARLYYEAYGLWKQSIDKCLVISSRIEKKLMQFGMKKEKLSYLEWKIPCGAIINRTWHVGNKPLQIGYAGRLTTIHKRVDLLPVLAANLREKGVCFQLNIAGEGEYGETLRQQAKKENLQDHITLVGYIEREKIQDFWLQQDIMVNCSDCEGHSISQSEAMAVGTVPVITDVSGARDDVTDGYNGYIVPVGNIDALADRISYLYNSHDELAQMGKRAHDTIYKRQNNSNQAVFWDDLLRKVW